MKIGRNDPCPCGSGKKYKKCCYLFHKAKTGDLGFIRRNMETRGDVRPIISTDFNGYKMVTVGNQLHYSKKWKTFHDFLFDYIKTCLGEKWGNEELRKSINEMHPILQWYREVCEFQKANLKNPGDVTSAVCTGVVGTYLALAYDLYVLRHHSKLQQKLLDRIKNKNQFQGSRYELYVASSFIKAGLNIEFENEEDGSVSHCEFTAEHKNTGIKYSVEAKSRHRPGFLGQEGIKQSYDEMSLRIGQLLNDALKKNAIFERIIFIDVNMPLEEEDNFKVSWFKSMMSIVKKIENDFIKNGEPKRAFLFFTNHPAHFIGKNEIDPKKSFFLTAMGVEEFKINDPANAERKCPLIFLLWESINTHLHVPHEFD